jgi:hypothetical protein
MFKLESDNHGYANRATWLAALWYLDQMDTVQALSIYSDGPVVFNTHEDVLQYIENELDVWAAKTTVLDAHLEQVELYYLLPEVDGKELFNKLKTKEDYERETNYND